MVYRLEIHILVSGLNGDLKFPLEKSYGHLKVQKWGFGPVARIVFFSGLYKSMVYRLVIHIWVIGPNGDLKLLLQKKLWPP